MEVEDIDDDKHSEAWLQRMEDKYAKEGSLDESYHSTPPSLAEFVTSAEYLEYENLSDVQLSDSIKVLGPDPKAIFSGGSQYRIGVFLWGKGGGKDWTCALLENYLIQDLLHMKNPHKFFGMSDKSYIDVLNVAPSQIHATTIYWEYFITAFKSNKWILQRFSLYEGNKLCSIEGNTAGKPKVHISAGEVQFDYPRIRARAYGADNESAEGGNPVAWIMDEADAFKTHTKIGNAKKIYSTLRSSAATRFGTKWKGFIISYPRSEDGFAVTMYNESQKANKTPEGDTIFGSRHATWEVLPPHKYLKQTFEFMGMNIPMDFYDDFTKYPEESMAKIACIPPKVESAFFSYRERIMECIKPNAAPLFKCQDTLIEHVIEGTGDKKKYIGKEIMWVRERGWNAIHTPRVIHVDGGLSNNRAALVMAHGEPIEIVVMNDKQERQSTFVNKVVVDAIVVWTPNKQKGLQVSLNSVETLILQLKEEYRFNIVRVSYDQWNSQTSLETFQSKGIRAEEYTIKDKDYFELRSMIYNGGVELLATSYLEDGHIAFNEEAELLVSELQRLQLLNGRKVDHPPESEGGSKDVADCLVGVNRLLNHIDEKHKTLPAFPKAVLGPGFARVSVSPFSATSQGVQGDLTQVAGIPKGAVPHGGVGPGQPLYTKQPDGKYISRPNQAPSMFPRSITTSSGGPRGVIPGGNMNGLPSHIQP